MLKITDNFKPIGFLYFCAAYATLKFVYCINSRATVGKERNAIDISVFGYKDAIPNCILVLDVGITTSKSLLSVVKNL